jgi:hypothetical protein
MSVLISAKLVSSSVKKGFVNETNKEKRCISGKFRTSDEIGSMLSYGIRDPK